MLTTSWPCQEIMEVRFVFLFKICSLLTTKRRMCLSLTTISQITQRLTSCRVRWRRQAWTRMLHRLDRSLCRCLVVLMARCDDEWRMEAGKGWRQCLIIVCFSFPIRVMVIYVVKYRILSLRFPLHVFPKTWCGKRCESMP
jgi:hypothetical protein